MKITVAFIVLLSLASLAAIPVGIVAGQIPDTGVTFTPPAGAVSNPTTVTFSAGAAGSIYCSTQDGSTPITNGIGTACVHGSLGSTTSITSAVTVKAVSGLLGELDSPVASAAYTIAAGITFINGAAVQCTTATTCSVNYAPTPGNKVVVCLGATALISAPTVVDNAGTPVTLTPGSQILNAAVTATFYYTAGSGVTQYTASWTTSRPSSVLVAEYSGAMSVNGTPTAGTASGNSATPSVSPTANESGDFAVACLNHAAATANTANVGNLREEIHATSIGTALADSLATGATSTQVATTISSLAWQASAVILRPSGLPLVLMGTPVSGDNAGTGQTKVLAYVPTTTGNTLIVYANQDTSTTNCGGLAVTTSGGETVVQPSNLPWNTAGGSNRGATNVAAVCNVASTASHNITITASGSGCAANVYVQGRVEEWQGLTNTCASLSDKSAGGTGASSTSVVSPNVTTTLAKELASGVGACGAGHTWTAGGSWTLGSKLDASDYNHSEYQILSSTQTLDASFTLNTADVCDGVIATFKGQ